MVNLRKWYRRFAFKSSKRFERPSLNDADGKTVKNKFRSYLL